MKKKMCAIVLLLNNYITYGQFENYFKKRSPYELSLIKDIPLTIGAAGLYGLGLNSLKKEPKPNFTIGQFTDNDISRINFIDRGAAGTWNPIIKNYGKPLIFTSSWLVPIGLISLPGNLKDRFSIVYMFYEGFYITGGLVTLSKGNTNRYRPFTYLSQDQVSNLSQESQEEYLEDIEGSDIEDSFFSGDAAKTAYGFTFFAKTFNDYYPSSRFKKWIWAGSITAIGLHGYFRVKSGKHFPTDVIFGSLIGGGVGLIIPHLHKVQEENNANFSLNITGRGLTLGFRF